MAVTWIEVAPQVPFTSSINWMIIDSVGDLRAGTENSAVLFKFDGSSAWISQTTSIIGGTGDIQTIAEWPLNGNKIIGSTSSQINLWNGVNDWVGIPSPSFAFKGEFIDQTTHIVFASIRNRRFERTNASNNSTNESLQLAGTEEFTLSFVNVGVLYGISDAGIIYSWDTGGASAPIVKTTTPITGDATNFVKLNDLIYFITNDGTMWSWDFVSLAPIQVSILFSAETDLRGIEIVHNEIYASTGNGLLLKWNGINAWEAIIDIAPGFAINSLKVDLTGDTLYGGDGTNGKLFKVGIEAENVSSVFLDCATPIRIASFGWFVENDISNPQTLSISTFGWLCGTSVPDDTNTDYCGQAKGRLIEQFENKSNINDYLCVLTSPFQELEFVFQELKTLRELQNAFGVQLDGLGDIVGIDRRGRSDTEYRDLIAFQAAINSSSGDAETLISIVRTITKPTNIIYTPVYPAKILIFTDGTNVDQTTVSSLLQSMAAGVGLELTSTMGVITPFAFAPEAGLLDANSLGFSEPSESGTGGSLSEKFT